MSMIKNGSGYYDPTAAAVLGKENKEINRERDKLTKVMTTIRTICDLAGFKIEGRITLVDKKTGKVWR